MNWRERRRFLSSKHTGLVLAPGCRLSAPESFRNLALVAPTGAGKTTRYVIPNVLAVQGSVVVTDPAGEIHAATRARLDERGFRIQLLQPANLQESLRFNPLSSWRSPQQLRQLATILARNTAGAQSDPFWSLSAVNLLFLVLTAVNREEEPRRTLGTARDVLNRLGIEGKGGAESFMRCQLAADERLLAEYRAFAATESRVQSSILSTARAALELWSDPEIQHFTASNTVDIPALRRERTAIFIIVPEHQVRYFGLLMNLVYSACFGYCLETSGDDLEPVYFFLDEFGNMGHIANFASIITTLRKRRCSISIILQDLAQLEANYGRHEARTIFSGGCASKLFYSGLDVETAEYVERVLGKRTEYDTTFGGIDEHARTVAVPLMTADQVRRMGWGEAILVSGREWPVGLPGQV